MFSIDFILKQQFKVSKLKDNSKGFILLSGEYLIIDCSHSEASLKVGMTLEDLLLENILRVSCFDKKLIVQKSKETKLNQYQETAIKEFVSNNGIKIEMKG